MRKKTLPIDRDSSEEESRPTAQKEKDKLTTFLFSDPNAMLKSLMIPRFLGSYHLKEKLVSNELSVANLVQNKVQMKLKSAVYNPITLSLIMIALAFNLFWLFFLLFR
ncbi:MAG: hypothetical protein ACTSU4_12680 [Promethearchaeota archaeon]